MPSPILRSSFACLALAAAGLAQEPSLTASLATSRVLLKYAAFDPALGAPPVPAALAAADDIRLWIVQLAGRPTEAMRAALRACGVQVHGYLPENCYLARAEAAAIARASALDSVRGIAPFAPAFRLDPQLVAEHLAGIQAPTRRYNLVVVDKRTDKPALLARLRAIGAEIDHEQPGSLLVTATLDGAQLLQAARFDEVQWIDLWSAPETDMDNARIQGGANYIEGLGGYTGQGVNGHIYEGIELSHPDFTITPTPVGSCSTADTHGHCTGGIVFGNGTSSPQARGMAPSARPFFTNYSCVNAGLSRWQVVQQLVTQHDVMFTTASWGGARVRTYTSVSADTDDIIFDHDIVWSNSQSNAGNQDSRPEAWAKNIISIGGVQHFNNSNPADDSWAAGGGSTGPAADLRIKPDLSAYYDSILCSDLQGAAGYSAGNFTTGFGGTSGATPIVTGHNALALQLFTDGVFGNTLRVPGGTRFQNRPHAATLKALQIAHATQYSFTAGSTDNRREHVGWGFPSLRSMWDRRGKTIIVDETDVLLQGQTQRYNMTVNAGEPELKIALCFRDPAGSPTAAQATINNLSLRVTSPSGQVYWGNAGLTLGNWSTLGGSEDTRDTVECVLLQNPAAGTWQVDVIATLIAQDAHVATSGVVDAAFGLVAVGPVGSGTGGQPGRFSTFGQSCAGSVIGAPGVCAELNTGGFTAVTMRNSTGYAYEVTPTSALSIEAIDLYFASRSGAAEVLQGGIYLPGVGGAPATQVRTGTFSIGTTAGWSTCVLNAPFQATPGQPFFLYFMTNPTGPSAYYQTGGTDVAYYRFEAGAWGTRTTGRFAFSWRLRCPGSRLAPVLGSSGLPEVNRSFNVTLANALPSTPVVLFIGFDDTSWNGLPLPFSLAGLNAPGCSIYVPSDVLATASSNAGGGASLPIAIPDDPLLIGAEAFVQYLVVDPGANGLGLATTNGGAVVIGG
ncbi:MAG: S8 family serine peptidase [Planctomycetes bacterium]|nr:S8 family serine peptidase [Planctomycetota bacterium]